MKIGILGTGDVAQALGKGFAALGHDVRLGSRTPGGDKAKAFVKEAGARGSEGSLADTARFGDIVIVAVPGVAAAETLKAIGPEPFRGKVVIDVTNPLDFSKGFGALAISGDDSAGETIQRVLADAKVVKTLNTVNARYMVHPKWAGGTPDMYLAGNDADAKHQVAELLRGLGWNPVDLGPITSSRWLEAMCLAWVQACFPTGNFGQAFKLIQFG